MRLVTFIGVGRDPHTFGLIADLGRQSFQCAAFWCQPHAGGLSEAVQAACMVSWGGNGGWGYSAFCFVLVIGAQDWQPLQKSQTSDPRADYGSLFYLALILFSVSFNELPI